MDYHNYDFSVASTSRSKNEIGKRVGIFGGSFNPIHIGHFKTAEYLLDKGYLDEVRFLLNPCSPFKIKNNMPDAYFRAMAILHGINSLADRYKENMDLDATEMLDSIQNHVCYTVNTLKKILYTDVQNKTLNEYFLIVGIDVFNSIKRFKNWKWFLDEKLVKFIVLPRGGYEINEDLREEFKELIVDVDYSNFEPIELSSTAVREWIANGNDTQLKDVLITGTYKYIITTGLYGYPNEKNKAKLVLPVKNEKTDNVPVKPKTYSSQVCREMVKNSPYKRISTYPIDIDNAFGVVKTLTNTGYTRYNVYDYSKGKVVCDEWFLSVGKLMTFDERMSAGINNAFQHNYERYNTKMFDTDNATYYAIVDTNLQIKNANGKTSTTAKNILAFNHNSCKYLFKDCVIGSSFITRIEQSGVYGVVFITLNNGTQIEYNLIKGTNKVVK
jgi:nicotinate-nucleotide adenylyltransferase